MSLMGGVALLLILLALSALFSGSETAVTSMERARLGYLVKEHPRRAKALQVLLEDPNSLITTILIANNFVNIFASSIATVLSIQLLRPFLSNAEAGLVATLLMTVFLLIFGEITPKSLAKNHAERFTLAMVRPIYALSRFLHPLIILFRWFSATLIGALPRSLQGREQVAVSEEQIKYLVDASEERGLLDKEEVAMIKRIFTYDDLVTGQVMVPRPDIKAIAIETSLEEVRKIVTQDGHSRFPVYEGDRDNMIGFLYAKDLLKGENKQMRELIRPPFYTSTTRPINELLRDFQREHQHMAVVVDEFGGIAGIVTLEDIVEEIVGEITDEYDEPEQPVHRISATEFIVDGDTEIDLLNERLGLELPLDEGVTISGLLLKRFEDIPEQGESLQVDAVRITIEEASEREIFKVRLELLPT